MAVPLVVPIAAGIIISGIAGGGVYLMFSDSDIEDVVKSVKNAKYPHEYNTLRKFYFEEYPRHTEAHFSGFLEWFVAGVVAMRAAGELEYSDYASASGLAIEKIWDTYKCNEIAPTEDIIYWAFHLLIHEAWQTEKGMKALRNAESQNFVQTMRNAIQRKIYDGKETEFVNEYSQRWMQENATAAAAMDKAAGALPAIGGSTKLALAIGLGIAAFLLLRK